MADDEITREEAERVLALDEDELYRLLIPQSEMDLYSAGGAVARGRARFTAATDGLRQAVCDAYRRRGGTEGSEIDLVILVATAIVGAPTLAGLAVLPAAALITKIGLREFCP